MTVDRPPVPVAPGSATGGARPGVRVRRAPPTIVNLLMLLAIPALLGAKGQCRRKPPADDGQGDVVVRDVPDVSAKLQVVNVSPSVLQPGTPTPVQVYGAGFDEGATVAFGALPPVAAAWIDANTLSATTPGLAEGSHDVRVIQGSGEATLRQGVRVAPRADDSCARMAMYFELDSSSLSPSVIGALDRSMPCLREKATIALEGHADERGTTDYNLALGQRRAEAVQRYLMNNGIAIGRLPVVSYGEERPAQAGSNEQAWAMNRRVEMVAR